MDEYNPMVSRITKVQNDLTIPRRVKENPEYKPGTVPAILQGCAATFFERNAIYGDTYKNFGPSFLTLFAEGALPHVSTPEEMNRLQLLMHIHGKVMRYAASLKNGGHQDSAHDIVVYAAMLEQATEEGKGNV